MPTLVPVAELYVNMSDALIVLDDTKIDKINRVALDALRSAARNAVYLHRNRNGFVFSQYTTVERHISLGKSDTASGWTDGATSIVLTEESFEREIWSVSGWTTLLLRIADHYAYTTADRVRDATFFERYHELSFSFAGAGGDALRMFAKALLSKHPDRAQKLRKAIKELDVVDGEAEVGNARRLCTQQDHDAADWGPGPDECDRCGKPRQMGA